MAHENKSDRERWKHNPFVWEQWSVRIAAILIPQK